MQSSSNTLKKKSGDKIEVGTDNLQNIIWKVSQFGASQCQPSKAHQCPERLRRRSIDKCRSLASKVVLESFVVRGHDVRVHAMCLMVDMHTIRQI